MRTTKSGKFAAIAVGLALVLAACSDDDKTTTTQPPSDTGGSETTTGETTPASDAAMTITYTINPDAVWDDGTPITWEDFQCTWEAKLNTPGSIETSGYDKITSVEAGAGAGEVVASFSATYAPYKGLFGNILKKAAVEDCNDVSGDFSTELPFSSTAWKLDSWSTDQAVLVPNENYWGDAPKASKLVIVPRPDNEIEALKAGEVDFIYPQFHAGIQDELADPNVKTVLNYGGDYEAMYMNLGEGRPFADAAFREAFYKSIDLDALFKQIYIPIAESGKLLTCGPIVPGDFCPDGIFGNKYDQAAADQVLTDAGYAKNGDGFWAKDGTVPEIKWMINAGNSRRESTQAYLIPLLEAAGFKVTADNCDAACVFQKRLPAADYDLAMYISTAPPDPAYLTPSFAGDMIPTEANGMSGQNFQNWNNATATEALHAADVEVDGAKRADLIKSAITEMDKDYILIPLFQFPKSGAYRTDKLEADAVEAQLNNYAAFYNTWDWVTNAADGQITIGAEQWPECLNPITECANSSWYVWTIEFPLLTGVWNTTNDGGYELTNLVTGEPVVTVNS